MVGGDAQDQHTGNFIFPGAFDDMGAGNPRRVGVPGVGVADGNDICGLFAEGIAETRRERVGDDDGLAASDTEAGMT